MTVRSCSENLVLTFKEIFREGLGALMATIGKLLFTEILTFNLKSKVEHFSSCVYYKSRALLQTVVFIDGTVIDIALPGGEGIKQRVVYISHKRKHAPKFQAITALDVLFLHLFGLDVKLRHDIYLFATFGVEAMLQENLKIGNQQYMV